ncbi:MAG: hypothetical protein GY820_41580 [Gammaproteobacteria bacterium]|nr:hypothetical protein [Gammaproteobacteria bacterium]
MYHARTHACRGTRKDAHCRAHAHRYARKLARPHAHPRIDSRPPPDAIDAQPPTPFTAPHTHKDYGSLGRNVGARRGQKPALPLEGVEMQAIA